ncbi:hypothetical protein BPAE_0040g00170 [Botrytis paeoniae]|uniref:Uncharacterized protein n=1 Tax=Botrytis paeoniae TaxID=278948 RepID=A0A4Z1FS46_9HELO|nr:hypothetical protein BPAE_0040g00170 [Botrytis paeoniae]
MKREREWGDDDDDDDDDDEEEEILIMGYVPRSSRLLELKIQELVLSVALGSYALVIESWLMIIGECLRYDARRQYQQLVLLRDRYQLGNPSFKRSQRVDR